ncbi:peroxisomal membrane protein PMP47B [Piptocephalis cylindrospora]|uniref:Peroxisomal membrane protein PMP47B n=1 Tax=Piptocephalis cylindrospora TaxID=1907219 RepID=A0A4P9Y8P1_9FUNG|nr:peroxisomal membrane protein PMP47B [Piptocephalis cylindrospora]|eukprot:RKP15395.1 peroxisomal membrane protein PMP47B [Piptocephalis cylindrospora]
MSDQVAHALAGASGGIISMALTYPLITVSSRQQVQKDNTSPETHGVGCMEESTLKAMKRIVQREGVPGLYSGLNSALLGVGLTNGVYYFFYEWARAAFEGVSKERVMSTLQSMSAGAIAGSATVLITNPIWVVNMRMTVQRGVDDPSKKTRVTPKPLSTRATIRKILREDGVKAFWQGVTPALILVANPIIQYTVYERLYRNLLTFRSSKPLTGRHYFLLGALSKLAATSLTYPYIVVKSRMQLRHEGGKDDKERYRSVLDAFKKILAKEGIAGLYKGIYGKLLQSILTAAFLFWAKEAVFKYIVLFLTLLGGRKRI